MTLKKKVLVNYERYGQVWILFIVSSVLFSTTSSLVWTSSAIPKMNAGGTVNNWLGECLLIGTLLGSPLSYIMLLRGPKMGLVVSSLAHVVAWSLLLVPSMPPLLYTGRVLAGVAITCQCLFVPAYIADCFQPKQRQMSGALMSVYSAIALTFEFSVSPFISYRATVIVNLVQAASLLIGFIILGKESPYTLIRQGKVEEARNVVLFFWNSLPEVEIEKQIKNIQESVRNEMKKSEIDKVKSVFSDWSNMKACLLSGALMVFYNTCGITQMAFYMGPIFFSLEDSSYSLPPTVCSAIVGGFKMFAAVISFTIVDRFGVKKTLVVSIIGNVVSLFVLGFYFFFGRGRDYLKLGWLPLVCLTAYGTFNMIGAGLLPLVLVGELIPVHVRGPAGAIVDTIGNIFGLFSNAMYQHFSYFMPIPLWVYASVNFIQVIFILAFIPETKDKSMSDIQESMINRRSSVV